MLIADSMVVNWVLWLLFLISFRCFLHAVDTDYPSANLSRSWINNDLIPRGSSHFADGAIVRPVLLNNSNILHFPAIGCGFYGNQNGDSFFFAIFAVQATNNSKFVRANTPRVIWTANRANPVRENATLRLTLDGDLELTDGNGTFVWSSNTSTMAVAQMQIKGNGRLALVDSMDRVIWQSWDEPMDAWFPGQTLVPGQRLFASVSPSNWAPGPFYLSVVNDELYAFIESDPPQTYSKIFNEDNESKIFTNGRLSITNNPTKVLFLSETKNFQYLRLDSDGHLRAYKWDGGIAVAFDDILTGSLDDCNYPTVCGNYGICTDGKCTCPVGNDGDPSYFRQSSKSRGCMEATQLSCQYSPLHHLLQLDDVSYFGFATVLANIDVERCKLACLKNCSCKAALFRHYGNFSTGNCSLPSQIFTLMGSPQGAASYNSSSFIKVQGSLVGPTPNPSVALTPNPLVAPSPNRKSIPQSSKKKPSRIALVLGPILASLVFTFLIIWTCFRVIRKRKYPVVERRDNNVDEDWESSLAQLSNLPMRFAYKDLESATQNFHKKLGGGGFGSVFEGTLGNGTKIAVKRLDSLGQGRKEFLAEVKTIGLIHHVNLVRLMGFCAEKSHRLLVYEYMSNGSLDKWIFHRTPETALEWEIRKKIILSIAKGLAYLHEDCRMRIAHLDIKPQNILLDDGFNAKLSDFGLARLIDKNQSQVITQMRGTRGYMAPEWLSRKITEKVDVYSFGIVVLEIVCGRKNLDFSQPEEDDHLLVHMVKKKAEENQLSDLVDKCSENMQQHGEEAVEMMMVAIQCLHADFTRRPSMSMVVKVLEGVMVMQPISDYSFLTSTVVEAPIEAVMVASTSQPASILSGPRS